MLATATIAEEILDLKKQRHAILLAHHYQAPEIQELADVIGDSLELARKAHEFEGGVIAFCGVWFMAGGEANPTRIVVVPDRDASCSLVEGARWADPRIRQRHPDHVTVSYINTSIGKAESDTCARRATR
jgi:quinolinate synthase